MWRAFIDAMAEWNSVAICGRLALAILTGTVIGIDRGLKRRGAGIKTHALVCLGSALVMLTSEYMSMNFDQKADLARLRMCICGPENAKELLNHHELIRVATKYPRIAKDYFYNKKHQTVEIIKLNGSIELAPIVGLSEVICDIVETGSTLRENGLSVLEEVCPLSARMVVNQVSMKMENERITKLISDLKTVI